MTDDLTFFTNDANSSLSDRFTSILEYAHLLDILVGYFRLSGFHLLKDSFQDVSKVRILNGINVDQKTVEILENLETSPRNTQETLEKYKRK